MAKVELTAKAFSPRLNGFVVRLEGRIIGRIVQDSGFVYQPKGKYNDARFWGDRFPTLAACKASLEG